MTQTSSTISQVSIDNGIHKVRARRMRFPQAYAQLRLLFSARNGNWGVPVCLLILALSFNLYRLGVPSIWFDEAFSVELARQPLPLLWHIIFGLEPNMQLYYLLLHAWLSLTGMLGLAATEFVVRLPSAIFAALSTLSIFFLGRHFLSPLVGCIAAGLYMLNDLQLVYAQQARSYSLQLVLICLAWYAFLLALTAASRQRQWWLCFVVATTLAIYAHLFSLIILLAQVCAYSGLLCLPQPWRSKVRRQIPAFLISLSCIFLCIIPLLRQLNVSRTNWLPVPQLLDVARLLLSISGTNRIYLFVLALCCGLALFVAVLSYLPRGASLPLTDRFFGEKVPTGTNSHADMGEQRRQQMQYFLPMSLSLFCWLIVPLIVSYAVSQGSIRLFASRYLVTLLPPLFLLVGMGVTALRWLSVRLILSLLLFMLALSAVPFYYRSAQVEDWNVTARWIEQHYQANDGLVCYDNTLEQGCQISIEYYFQAYPTAAHFSADSPGAFSWRSFSAANPDAAVDPSVLAVYGARHPRLFFIVGRLPNDEAAYRARTARIWLDRHYHCIGQIVTRTIIIRLYTTSTSMTGLNI